MSLPLEDVTVEVISCSMIILAFGLCYGTVNAEVRSKALRQIVKFISRSPDPGLIFRGSGLYLFDDLIVGCISKVVNQPACLGGADDLSCIADIITNKWYAHRHDLALFCRR